MAEVDLDLAQVLALLQQVGGVGMAQRVDVSGLGHAAGFERQAEGSLERGVAHRLGRGFGAVAAALALGWKQESGITMGFPLFPQQQESALRQGNVAIIVTLAGANVQEHALRIDVANFQAQPFTQAQAAGIDDGQTNPMIQRGDLGQDAADFGGREDDGQFELGIGADQFDFMGPGAAQGFFPEHLDGAQGLGAGLAGDFLMGLEMDEVLANLLDGDLIGRATAKLAQMAHARQVSLDSAWTDGQEF